MISSPGSSPEALASGIRACKPEVEALIARFRRAVEEAERTQDLRSRKYSGPFWVLVAYTDALVRLRLFLEQNLNYLESLGLLALTRYVFELVVWLKLMEQDRRYGLVYYHDLLLKQRRYYEDLREHLEREISFLDHVQSREEALLREVADEVKHPKGSEATADGIDRRLREFRSTIDSEAARTFSMYTQAARTNGYGFQAHLVKTKKLPAVANACAQLEGELTEFNAEVPAGIRDLIPNKWNWRQLAGLVGMQPEYDFIYSYTSRLLHATPASLTTDQKNLEADEMRIFLTYLDVRLRDIIASAPGLLSNGAA
jgi:hypothetical protein